MILSCDLIVCLVFCYKTFLMYPKPPFSFFHPFSTIPLNSLYFVFNRSLSRPPLHIFTRITTDLLPSNGTPLFLYNTHLFFSNSLSNHDCSSLELKQQYTVESVPVVAKRHSKLAIPCRFSCIPRAGCGGIWLARDLSLPKACLMFTACAAFMLICFTQAHQLNILPTQIVVFVAIKQIARVLMKTDGDAVIFRYLLTYRRTKCQRNPSAWLH